MEKEKLRKVFFKLKFKGHSYNQCRKILFAKYGYEVTIRTLQRWINKLNTNKWDLMDESTRPKRIHRKITPDIEKKILEIRTKTGWGENKIEDEINLGHTSINKILNQKNNGALHPKGWSLLQPLVFRTPKTFMFLGVLKNSKFLTCSKIESK